MNSEFRAEEGSTADPTGIREMNLNITQEDDQFVRRAVKQAKIAGEYGA